MKVKKIRLTGMKQAEGGNRAHMSCVVMNEGKLKKFHPLAVVSDEWEKWYIESRHIKLCELYYPPFNFERTGCKGCPYATDLQHELQIMERCCLLRENNVK